MNFSQILLQTYESDIEELEIERAELTYYPGFDGEIVEKFVTCKRTDCICHRGYPHGPNKYFRYREGKAWKELYLGKKIQEEYLAKVESNRRIKEIDRELRSLRKKRVELRERLGLADENSGGVQMTLDVFSSDLGLDG